MASLQERSGSWRVIFRFRGLQHFVTIGEVEETEASDETAGADEDEGSEPEASK